MPRQDTIPLNRSSMPDNQGQIEVGLPVTAPLVVAQPRTEADNLKDALDAFTPVAKQGLQLWEQKNAKQGATDAATNPGTPDKFLFDNSPAYHQNFLATTEQARWNLYKAHMTQEYAGLLNNPTLTPEDVNKWADQRFKEFLTGPDGQPHQGTKEAAVAARILPQLEQFRAQLVSNAGEQIQARQQDHFTQAAGINAMSEYAQTGKLDVNKLHDSLVQTLGGSRANAALAQILTTTSERFHDPAIIGSLPDKWADGTPGLMSTQYGTPLLHVQNTASNLQAQDHAQAADADKANLLKSFADKAAAGIPITWEQTAAKDRFDSPILTPEQRLGWYKQNQDAQADAQRRAIVDRAIAAGDGSERLLVGQIGITPADIQAGVDRKVAAAAPEQQLPVALKLAAVTGHASTQVKDYLSNPGLQNPKVLESQLNIWRAMQAANPGATSLFVDDKTAAVYQSASLMQDGGMTPEQIAQTLNNRDPKQQAHIDVLQKDVAKQLGSMDIGTVVRRFIWNRDATGKDVQNPGDLVADISATARQLAEINPGRYVSADALMQDAANLVKNRYVYVNGWAVKKTPDMPPAQQLTDAWKDFSDNAIPKLLEGTKYTPDQVELRPDPVSSRDHTSLAIYLKGSIVPISSKRYTYADLVKYHDANAHADHVEAIRKATADNAARAADYEKRAAEAKRLNQATQAMRLQ